MDFFKIGKKIISKNNPPYIVAEMSGNHCGDLSRALKMVELASETGADAIKLQTFTPDTMTLNCDRDEFLLKDGLWEGKTLYDLYSWAQTPWEWHEELFKKAKECNIDIFSSPFDETAVDFLENLDVPAYKLASFEMTDLPLVQKIASTKRPIIMSTGMATLDEIKTTIQTIKEAGNEKILVLHCVSQYPTNASNANLASMVDLKNKLQCEIGLSDHTKGSLVPIVSIGLGACFIEKHFIDDKSKGGPDVDFSLEPDEFKKMVEDVHTAWRSIGKSNIEKKEAESSSRRFRRSIYFIKELKAGEVITKEHLKRVRPNNGLEPKHYFEIIGKKVTKDVIPFTPTSFELIEK